MTDRDYRDWGHLNTPGAEKWSRFVSKWLIEQGGVEATTRAARRDAAPVQ